MNRVTKVCDMRITVNGRMLLEELERKEEVKTSIGLIRQNKFAIYKWIFGIAAAVIGGYVLRWLTAG